MTGPLTFPRRPIVEWFLNDDWRDISTDIRQKPGITIIPGRKDEAANTPPCKCTFVLDDGVNHGDGDYNPENAGGEWYGELGRNTPIRVSLAYGEDAFTRTSASGWGTSPAMGAWSTFQSAGTVASDISSNQGRHQVTSTSAFIASYLDDVSVKDVDLYVEHHFDTAISNVTGGSLEPANIMVRGQDTSTYYMLRVTISTSEVVGVALHLGSSTVLATGTTGGTFWGTTDPMSVRFQADGGTIRAKVWKTSLGEPLAWNLEYNDPDPLGAGWVGVRSGVATGNSNTKPINNLYDNLEVRLPRFAGYTAKMVPTFTVDHRVPIVTVEAAGLLRIVRQGTTAIGTPFERYAPEVLTVVDYWPLDETPEASRLGVNTVAGGSQAIFVRDFSTPLVPKGAIKWAATDGLLSMNSALQLTEGGLLKLPVRTKAFSTQWSASWMQKISADSGGSCWLRTQESPSTGDISFIWYTDGSYEVYWVNTGGGGDILLFSGTFTKYGFDDTWHSIAFSAVDSGADIFFLLAVDGVMTNNTLSPAAFDVLLRFEAQGEITSTQPSSYAQFMAFPERIDDIVDYPLTGSLSYWLDQAYRGWPTEPAAARFVRLCNEEGKPYSLVGDPNLSPPMGPQRDRSLIDQLLECVEVDQGSLFEPKGSPALGLVTTRALVDKTPIVTLDYGAGEIAPAFGPIRDDQSTVNDVTAKRLGGDGFRVEKISGPLNVNDPGTVAGGAGRIAKPVEVNVDTDDWLPDQASWRVHLGTVDEARFANITVDLAGEAFNGDLARTALLLDVCVDDVVHVTNAEVIRIYSDVRQVARGWTEKYDTQYLHTITFNTTPASPYDQAVLGSSDKPRAGSDSSTLDSDFAAGTATSMSVVTTGNLWSTAAAQYPQEINVGGVVFEVTAVSGASSPQTFTVTQAPVNGVPNKTIRAGTSVKLARPVYTIP